MNEAEHDPPDRDHLMRDAATWFARMRGPGAEDRRPAFEAWLASSALHRSAYNRAAEIFAMGKLLGEHGEPVMESPASWREGKLRVALTAVTGVAILSGAALLGLRGHWGPEPASRELAEATPRPWSGAQVIATDFRRRTIHLGDGSVVRLAPESRLEVVFDGKERRLTLEKGGGRFEVGHELRPFVVHAGGGSVTARGTIFDVVLAQDRRVSVRLIEGLVDVALPRTAADRPANARQLRPGQRLSFTVQEYEAETRSVLPRPQGQSGPALSAVARDFDNIVLSDLIEQANRGASMPIRLANPALGKKRISGRFSINDTGLLADRLAVLLGLSADRIRTGEIMLRK